MSENKSLPTQRRGPPRAAVLAITLTATACVAALIFRTPIQSRYWAWRIQQASRLEERDAYLGALCNAAAAGRWGTAALLASDDAEVRQYGVLVLHHVNTPWAREQLLNCLTDSDPAIQRLAAVGLAIRGDDAVVPTLKWLYQTGDSSAAATACLAFERLGTREAIAALNELATEPNDVTRRAALADALVGISAPECVPGLLHLLSDDRVCPTAARSEEMARRALGALQTAGYALEPASHPTTAVSSQTVAERAAAGLARITGLREPFSSAAPAEERAQAERAWSEWYARRQADDNPPNGQR